MNLVIPAAPPKRDIDPQFSIGSVFDIPCGTFIKSKNDETVLLSGISYVNSVVGPENSFKTGIMLWMMLRVLARYKSTQLVIFDTEGSFSYNRLNKIIANIEGLEGVKVSSDHSDLIQIVSSSDMPGDKFFQAIRATAKDRAVEKGYKKTLPYLGAGGNPVSMRPPILIVIDSLSEFKDSGTEDKEAKETIGSSKLQTMFMHDGLTKTQLQRQLPDIAQCSDMIFGLVAHVGTKIEMDPHAPQAPKLAFARRGVEMKGVSNKFKFINNNLWQIENASFFPNSSQDKSAKYPYTEADRDDKVKDLMKVVVVQTRNKAGNSGDRYELMFSQSRGFLPELTNFHYCKVTMNDYGIKGSAINYHLCLYPEVTLSRTTVATKLIEDRKLATAMEYTTQMAQMLQRPEDYDSKYRITDVSKVYETIKSYGYDWDILLNTRNYPTFMEDEKDLLPHLSTLDLLRIYNREYIPKWYEKVSGKKIVYPTEVNTDGNK